MKADSPWKRYFNIGMGVYGAVIALDGLTVPFRSHDMTTIAVHHLLHAGMVAGMGLLAMSLAVIWQRRDRERAWWALPAALMPVAGLFLMWPSEYANLMSHPWLHFLDHLGIALTSGLAVFAAQAYVRGLGWPMLAMMVAMNAAAAGGFGITFGPGNAQPETAPATVAESSAVKPGEPVPLHVLGKKLAQNLGCTACHRIDEGKAVGPSWKNLAGYPQKMADGTTKVADYQFLRDAILYPEKIHLVGYAPGAMPSSYRAMLSGPDHPDERDLHALIWYINTLSDRSDASTQPPVPDVPSK